jgi:hypothetical protein
MHWSRLREAKGLSASLDYLLAKHLKPGLRSA